MSFEFHINGNQTTFFILFVLRSCTFGFADYTWMVRALFARTVHKSWGDSMIGGYASEKR